MRLKRPKAVAGAVMALTLFPLAACGGGGEEVSAGVVEGSWEKVVEAAKEEGKVSVYTAGPPLQNDRLLAAFEAAYPDIKVEMTRGAGELPARVEQEIATKSEGADVFIYPDPALFSGLADNLLEAEGPNVADWSDDFWAEKGKAIVPIQYPWTMLVWNTEIFPDGFDSWDDLLAPEVKGKLAMRNDATASLVAAYEFMEMELGEEFMEALGSHGPKYYPSAVPMAQAVASGEVGVTPISTPAVVKELTDAGAPIDFAFPEPGFAAMWGAGALDTSKRPNAATVFLDFMMSKEGQTAITGDGLGASGRSDVTGALDLEGWELFDSTLFTPEKMTEMQALLDRYFGN